MSFDSQLTAYLCQTHIIIVTAFRAASNCLLASKVHNCNYVHTIIEVMLKRRNDAHVSTSLFFIVMAVAAGIARFLTRANLLLNSINRKIQDDPGGNFTDEFQGQNSRAAENHSREITRQTVLRQIMTGRCPSRWP